MFKHCYKSCHLEYRQIATTLEICITQILTARFTARIKIEDICLNQKIRNLEAWFEALFQISL